MSTKNLFSGTVESTSIFVGADASARTGVRQVDADPNGVLVDRGGALALNRQTGQVWQNVATLGSEGSVWVLLMREGGPASGDLSGAYPDPVVSGIRGRPVVSTAPGINESLTWNGSAWTPQAVGAGSIVAVYGSFYSNDDQSILEGTDVSVMYFEHTMSANGVTVVDPGTGFATQITVAQSGVYAFTLSPQILKNAGGGSGQVSFWVRKGGVDVPNTASFIDVTNNEHALPYIELLLPMAAGEYIEWAVHSNVLNVRLENEPASLAPAVVRPAAPSILMGVKRLGA